MDLGIVGRRALVTGSHRGTGLHIARTLAREGAIVFVHGPPGGGQDAVSAELREAGAVAHSVSGELTTDAGADSVSEAVAALGESIDILVNNLGQAPGGRWHALSTQEWVDVYQHNTLSAVRMLDRFVPAMRQRGWGRVVQLATIGVLRPGARMPHYYASKAALANLTLSLAKDLAGTGVTANTVSPGLIRTPEIEQYFKGLAAKHDWGTEWETIERRGVEKLMPNPLQRMATTEEVASLVVYLCSDVAAYVNGTNIRIDGGATDLAV